MWSVLNPFYYRVLYFYMYTRTYVYNNFNTIVFIYMYTNKIPGTVPTKMHDIDF